MKREKSLEHYLGTEMHSEYDSIGKQCSELIILRNNEYLQFYF